MFRFEKEMIPILKKELSSKYDAQYFVDEFDCGNGIADLVYTTRMREKKDLILGYELIYLVLTYLNRKNKKIQVKSFYKDTFLTKKKARSLLQFLLDGGNIEKLDDDNFIVKEKYCSPVKDIISIEAKLYDWRSGLFQALRYKPYSNKCYLAVSQEFSHRVDVNILRENNIGLMTVAPDKVDIVMTPKKENPSNMVAHMYLAEKFYSHAMA